MNLSNDVSFCVDLLEVIEDDVTFANDIIGTDVIKFIIKFCGCFANTMDPEIIFKVYSIGVSKVVIEVIDNGVGISDLDKKQLFDPFFTTKDSGTGLGLSIVFQIISDHQGRINVLDNDPMGTIIRIELPQLLRPKIIEGQYV